MKNCIPLFVLSILCAVISVHARPAPMVSGPIQNAAGAHNLSFVANVGQLRNTDGKPCPEVGYYLWHNDVGLYTRPGGLSYVFRKRQHNDAFNRRAAHRSQGRRDMDNPEDFRLNDTLYRMDMDLLGANPEPAIIPENAQAGVNIYYLGHAPQGLRAAQYTRLRYKNVYPNIDLLLYLTADGLKYDFHVHPGGNPGAIRMRYTGADVARIEKGGLLLRNPLGEVHEQAPYSYQRYDALGDSPAFEQKVASRFVQQGDIFGFAVAAYDTDRTLVLDPGVLWSTYFGGSDGQDEYGESISVGKDGGSVFVGSVYSSDFPATVGAKIGSTNISDAYVGKMSATGRLLWAMYYGGTEAENALAVVVDDNNGIVVTGWTTSWNFPDENAYQDSLWCGASDAFIMKFGPDGTRRWATFFGGCFGDQGYGVDTDGLGHIGVFGWTGAQGADFPLINAHKRTKTNLPDLFIAKISSSGQPLWSTFYGGSDAEIPGAMAVDRAGNVYCTGRTASTNFEIVGNAFQDTYNGFEDGFIVKMSSLGIPLYSSYFGGSHVDDPTSLALDSLGNIGIAGTTTSQDFPLLNAIQTEIAYFTFVHPDNFYAKFDKNFQQLFTTYFGGDSAESSGSICFNREGIMTIGGSTLSDNFPVTPDALQNRVYGPTPRLAEASLVQLSPEGQLLYATMYGRDGIDYFAGVASEHKGNVLAVGLSYSDNMPVVNAFQSNKKGLYDILLMRYGCDISASITVSEGTLEFCRGDSVVLDAGADFASYEWSDGSDTRYLVVKESGSYYCTVSDDLNCTIGTEPVQVKVFELPKPTIIASGPTEICAGQSVELTASEHARYLWSNGETTRSINVDTQGPVTLTVWNDTDCEAQVDTAIYVRKIPQPVSDPPLVDFGELDPCKSTAELDIIIENPEDFDIEVAEVEFSDPAYSLSFPTIPTTVRTKRTRTFTVVFAPGPGTPDQATMTLRGTPCDFELTVDLKGSKSNIAVAADPQSVNFGGNLLCAVQPRDTSIIIDNTGDADLIVMQPRVTAPYEITAPMDFDRTVPPGESLQIDLRYTPANPGTETATLVVPYTSGACRDSLRISLSARAADPVLALLGGAVDFGRLTGCEGQKQQSITLENSSEYTITVTAVNGDANVADQSGLNVEIAPGARGNLPLTFTPANEGPAGGSVTIQYRVGECTKTLELSYSGEKEGVNFALAPALDFGTLLSCEGTNAAQTLTLRYTNGAAVEGNVSGVSINGPFTTTLTENTMLPNGQAIEFEIRFEPSAEGPAGGSLTLTLEPCGIQRTITLTANYQSAELIAPAPVQFGTVAIGQSAQRDVIFTNNSGNPVRVDAFQCLDAAYTVVSPAAGDLPITVEPGGTLTVRVRFESSIDAATETTLCVASESPCSQRFEAVLHARPGTESSSTRISIPRIEVNTTDRNVILPVILEEALNLTATSFRAQVRINATTFFPRSISPDVEAEMRLVGEEWVIDVEAQSQIPLAGEALLEILGDALLGNEAISTIELSSFVWTDAQVNNTTLESGQLVLLDLCEAGGATRLLSSAAGFGIASINPNPSDGTGSIAVIAVNGAPSALEIYSVSGELQYREEWRVPAGHNNQGALRIIRPASRLQAGVYHVVFRSSVWTDTARLLIVR